jgi:hypothetical protein
LIVLGGDINATDWSEEAKTVCHTTQSPPISIISPGFQKFFCRKKFDIFYKLKVFLKFLKNFCIVFGIMKRLQKTVTQIIFISIYIIIVGIIQKKVISLKFSIQNTRSMSRIQSL